MGIEEKILEKQKSLTGKKPLEFPLERLQVDQTKGVFSLGNGEKQELGKEIEVVFVKRYAEFICFDPEKEKITYRTTIEESARDCKDLFTGTPAKELKDTGIDMKFTAHYIVMLKTPEGFIPADLQVRGAVVNAIIESFSNNKNLSKLPLGHIVKMKLKQKKKGAVKYFVPEFEVREATEEEVSEYLDLVDEPVEKFEEFRKSYNARLNTGQERQGFEQEEFNDDIPDF